MVSLYHLSSGRNRSRRFSVGRDNPTGRECVLLIAASGKLIPTAVCIGCARERRRASFPVGWVETQLGECWGETQLQKLDSLVHTHRESSQTCQIIPARSRVARCNLVATLRGRRPFQDFCLLDLLWPLCRASRWPAAIRRSQGCSLAIIGGNDQPLDQQFRADDSKALRPFDVIGHGSNHRYSARNHDANGAYRLALAGWAAAAVIHHFSPERVWYLG